MRVLGLIPARGGSKGIPRKNVRHLGGKPLIVWTAEAALGAPSLDRVVVSTEDDEIAEVARDAGLEVPFRRPTSLAEDETPMLPVVIHAVETLEAGGDRFDAVCLLQPTSPFRGSPEIEACVALLDTRRADSVVTVLPVPARYNPHWTYLEDAEGWMRLATGELEPIPRRQELPTAFHREGSVYVTRREVLDAGSLYGSRLLGYPMDETRCVNLDSPGDWSRAEAMLAQVEAG